MSLPNLAFNGPDTLLSHAEIISPAQIAVKQKVIIPVPKQLTDRRIYLFVDTNTTGDFVMYNAITTLNELTPVDYFRADLCSFVNNSFAPSKSLINCFGVGGSAVGDSITVQLAAPFNASLPTVVAQPLRINSTITSIQFEIESFAGLISGWRAWLGCISSNA